MKGVNAAQDAVLAELRTFVERTVEPSIALMRAHEIERGNVAEGHEADAEAAVYRRRVAILLAAASRASGGRGQQGSCAQKGSRRPTE